MYLGEQNVKRVFLYLNCLYIGSLMFLANQAYSPIMPFGGLLGDSRYIEFSPDIPRVQELSLGEAIRGSDVSTVEKNLF